MGYDLTQIQVLIKKLVGYLIIGGVSVATTLAAFEGILAIALLGQQGPVMETAQAVEAPSREAPPTPEVTKTEKEEESRRSASCNSDYYAVFDLSSGTACARNPTPLMAHWGPPSAAWFRSLGGEFRTRSADSTASNQCACLAEQPEYRLAAGSIGLRPVDHVLYEAARIPIRKWVCGDPCMTVDEESPYEP